MFVEIFFANTHLLLYSRERSSNTLDNKKKIYTTENFCIVGNSHQNISFNSYI
jgi:hypothetical protein